jgi:hypothetical protein
MKTLAIVFLFGAGLMRAQDFQDNSGSRTLWRVSMMSLTAANAIDIHSSWGKHELNPGLSGRKALSERRER